MNRLSALTQPSPQTSVATSFSFDRHNFIPLSPHHFWRIESGIVRTTSVLEDGTLIILGIWGPGDYLGSLLAHINPFQVECLTQVKLTLVQPENNPSSNSILIKSLQQIQQLTLIRSHKKLDLMLVGLLQWLAGKFGREMNQGQLIDIRLTHQDLADFLGTTRVTITRLLSQLEQQGMIERLPLHRIVLKEDEVWHYEI